MGWRCFLMFSFSVSFIFCLCERRHLANVRPLNIQSLNNTSFSHPPWAVWTNLRSKDSKLVSKLVLDQFHKIFLPFFSWICTRDLKLCWARAKLYCPCVSAWNTYIIKLLHWAKEEEEEIWDWSHLCSTELDARLALDQCRGNLHDDGLDCVGGTPALFGQQLHANGTADEHITTLR